MKLYLIIFLAISIFTIHNVMASGGHHYFDVDVDYTSSDPVTVDNPTIVNGVSKGDLAKGLSTTAASGSHQFDFATHDWQGSIVGAWYDEEDSVSFGVGKRFEKIDALFHSNYTQNGDDALFVFGFTGRF